ncbi:MAG TPA: PGPGW domain-containing protein [Gemmatimonadaceae bacterium]
MLERLKEYWAELKKERPGSRFQEQYDKNRQESKSRVGHFLRVVGGVLLFPVGVFFLAVPGPGLLVIALGAVLIAREFRSAAKILDHLEVRGRKIWKWARDRWRRLVQARRKVVNR